MISDAELDMAIIALNVRYTEGMELPDECDVIVPALMELKQRRECELRPATKFVNATLFQHNDKFIEEFNEVQAAFYDYTENSTGKNKEHLIEEIIDVQLAGETYLAGLGLSSQQCMAVRCKKMKTNTERGYYDGPVADQNKFGREADELSKAAAPLIELMQRKYNPHNKIIVTLDRIEVLSGEMGVPVEVQEYD